MPSSANSLLYPNHYYTSDIGHGSSRTQFLDWAEACRLWMARLLRASWPAFRRYQRWPCMICNCLVWTKGEQFLLEWRSGRTFGYLRLVFPIWVVNWCTVVLFRRILGEQSRTDCRQNRRWRRLRSLSFLSHHFCRSPVFTECRARHRLALLIWWGEPPSGQAGDPPTYRQNGPPV